MTEIDQLLSRLRRLEPIALDSQFKAAVQRRAQRRIRGARATPLASLAVFGTAVMYLTWALHFTSALYP